MRLHAPEVETLRRKVFRILGGEKADGFEEFIARVGFFPRTANPLLLRGAVGDVPR